MGLINSSVKVAENLTDAPQDTDSDQDDAQLKPTKAYRLCRLPYRSTYVQNGAKTWTMTWRWNWPTHRGSFRPTWQSKTDSRSRIHLGREESEEDRSFSLLALLVRTACPDDRTDVLASVVDSMIDFSLGHFSKERIFKLSEDLSHTKSQFVRERHPAGRTDLPAHVLILTVMDPIGSDESGQ